MRIWKVTLIVVLVVLAAWFVKRSAAKIAIRSTAPEGPELKVPRVQA